MPGRRLALLLAVVFFALLAAPTAAGPPLSLQYYTEFKLTPNEFADGAALKTAVAHRRWWSKCRAHMQARLASARPYDELEPEIVF